MRTALLTAIAGLFLTFLPPHHVQSQEIAPAFSLEVGESFTLSTHTASKRWQQGKIVRDVVVSGDGKIDVLSETDSGYRIRMTQTAAEQSGDSTLGGVALKAVIEGMVGTSIELETDASAVPVRAIGWKPLLEKVFADVKEAAFENVPPEAKAQAAAMVDQIVKGFMSMDEEAAALMVGQDLALWASWHNFELTVGEPVSYTTPAPNPFGGAPLEYDATVSLVSAEDGIAIIEVRQEADGENLQKVLDSFFALLKLPDEVIAKLNTAIQQTGVEMSFDQRFEVSLDTGRTLKVDQQKLVKMGDLLRDEESKTVTLRN